MKEFLRGMLRGVLRAVLAFCLVLGTGLTMAQPSAVSVQYEEIEQEFNQIIKLLYQGDYTSGRVKIQALLLKSQQHLGERDQLTLKVHDYFAGVLRRLGQLPQARQEFERILELHRQAGTEESLLALASLNNLAAVIEASVSPKAALPLYEKAMAQRTRIVGDDHLESVTVLDDYASALGESGQLHEALPLLQRALQLREAGLGENHPWTLTTRNNYAHLLFRLGRFQAALDLHERNLKARLSTLGEHHPSTWTSMSNAAKALMHLGRFEEAQTLGQRALKLQLEKFRATNPSVLASRRGVAGILVAQGYLEQAEWQYLQLLEDSVKTYGAEHQQVQLARIGLARVQIDLGKAEEAERELDAAWNGYLNLYGEGHFSALEVGLLRASLRCRADGAKPAAAELLLLSRQVETHYGRDFFLMPRAESALAECLLNAGDLVTSSQLFERLAADASSGETDFELWHDSRSQQHARLGAMFRLHAQALAGLGYAGQAYEAQEKNKARQLLAQLSERVLASSSGISENVWLKMQVARERLYAAKAALRDLTNPQDRPARVADLQSAAQVIKDIRHQWSASFPGFRSLSQLPLPDVNLDASLLPRDALYVSYMLDHRGRLFASSLNSRAELRWHSLGHHPGLTDAIEAFRFHIQRGVGGRHAAAEVTSSEIWSWQEDGVARWRLLNKSAPLCPKGRAASGGHECRPGVGRAATQDDLHRLLAHLSRILLKPMAERSEGVEYSRWIISPDSNLGSLPFDVLEWKQGPVVAAVAVSQVQSLAVLRAQSKVRHRDRQPGSTELDLFALGNPDFSPFVQEPATEQNRLNDGREGNVTSGSSRQNGPPLTWPPLPSSEMEIMLAVEQFDAEKTYVLDRARANKYELSLASATGVLASAKHVLFATHLWLHPDRPQDSLLALSQSNGSQDLREVDHLSLADIMGLRMSSDLTVVSACSSALSDMQANTTNPTGFAYALQVAGNRNAVLTLWPVFDRSTAHFVGRFFHHVAEGLDHSTALQKAKLEFLRHPNKAWRSPDRWAGFVLFGQ